MKNKLFCFLNIELHFIVARLSETTIITRGICTVSLHCEPRLTVRLHIDKNFSRLHLWSKMTRN